MSPPEHASDGLIDIHKIATNVAQKAVDRLLESGERFVKTYWARYKNRDVNTYSSYLKRKGTHVNSVRNLVYDTHRVSLNEIYVPTTVNGRLDTVFLQDFCEPNISLITQGRPVRPSKALAVTGVAGMGKSLLMRHAFFQLQTLDVGRIPIFVEARSFNRTAAADIEAQIRNDFTALGIRVLSEQISNALDTGLFTVLIDGVDEIKPNIQELYEQHLASFLLKFPHCPVLISSRPMTRFLSITDIEVYRIDRLTLPSAVSLIEKVEFDTVIKDKFIQALRVKLFSTHYEFASVPLLCTIMLLTFSDSGYIATDKHEFYEDAFTALWSKHDGRKDGFQRQRHTNLNKNEFIRLLSGFAVSSYSTSDYDMREMQIHRHFAAGRKLSGVDMQEEDFIEDVTVSTSVMVRDGNRLRFCHRSFHEYFAALFICEVDDRQASLLIDRLSNRLETDSVLPLVLSINREKIERGWSLPLLRSIVSRVGAYSTTRNLAHAIAGRRGDATLARDMNKIRALYNLTPTNEELNAAFDAQSWMFVDQRIAFQRNGKLRQLFEKDRSNFRTLLETRETLYAESTVALSELLDQDKASRLEDQGEIEED